MDPKSLLRVGSLDYEASEAIKHHSLDYKVNRRINSKFFEEYEQRIEMAKKMQKGDQGV